MKQKHEADPVVWRAGSDSLITGIVALILAIAPVFAIAVLAKR